MRTLKYLSLFSGIGGFEVGLENSKYEFETIEQVYQLTESEKRSTSKLQKVTLIYEDEDENTEAVDTSLMFVYYNGSYYLLERTDNPKRYK